jgi:hypothetical protein
MKRGFRMVSLVCALAGSIPRGRADCDVLRWSSAGGGWRNFVTNMAYANVFAQAG